MSKHPETYTMRVRVYYQDTDAGGVVYHANFVNFMERARTEWLRTFGYTGLGMMREFGMLFVVRSLKVDYLKPAVLDDLLEVTATIRDVGRSRVTLHQEVRRGDELLAEGEVHLVCVTKDAFKPVAIPEALRGQWIQ